MNEEEKKYILSAIDFLQHIGLIKEARIIKEVIERQQTKIDKAIEYIGIDEELEKCCDMYDVNGIDLLRILKGEQ